MNPALVCTFEVWDLSGRGQWKRPGQRLFGRNQRSDGSDFSTKSLRELHGDRKSDFTTTRKSRR